ncbi:MAG: PKD domain-containing protein, partial [Halanaerobiales bacterium]|nr:PKD domain-containing protein [Halanaerobiales bacterium]
MYGIGSIRGEVDLTGWIVLEDSAEMVEIRRNDLLLEHNHRYYLSVKAKNNAGVWSEVGYDDGFLFDSTKPVVDLVAGPADYLNSKTQIKNISFTSHEDEVGIKAYRYQIVAEEEDKDDLSTLSGEGILLDQENGEYAKTVEVIFDAEESLDEGRRYYIAIQTQNILNTWSKVGSSLGFIIDTIIPDASFSEQNQEIVTNGEEINVYWTTTEAGTVYYKLKTAEGNFIPAKGYDSKTIETVGKNLIGFNQTVYGNYELFLFMQDKAGNPSVEISQKIRVNAPPVIGVGEERSGYKGRDIEINDRDLLVYDPEQRSISYHWDFGDGTVKDTSILEVSHAFKETGEYWITLTATDADGGKTSASLKVVVTNTYDGELRLDEVWEGKIILRGDIIVPAGVVLTIQPGSEILIPDGKMIRIDGTIKCIGTDRMIEFKNDSGTWKGIYLSDTAKDSIFENVIIENAERALILNGQCINIKDSIFRGNKIGIHLYQSSPNIQDCCFADNFYYGIKEEGVNQPVVNGNIFSGNGIAPYYHHEKTVLNVEEV